MPDPIIADQNQTTPPPTFPEIADVPNIPVTPQEASPPPQVSEPENITPITDNSQPKKKKKGKILLTILGIFLLVGAVGTGVILVGQKQLFQQKAACGEVGQACYYEDDCCSNNCNDTTNKCEPAPTTCSTAGDSCTTSQGCPGICGGTGVCQDIADDCPTQTFPPAGTPTPGPPCRTCSNGDCVNSGGLGCDEDSSECDTDSECGSSSTPTPTPTPTPKPSCSGISCTSSSCTTGSSYNQTTCWVAHYWCQDVNGIESCDTHNGISLGAGQSASYSKECGVEQIDIVCASCGIPHSPIIRGTDFISIDHGACTTPTTPPGETSTPTPTPTSGLTAACTAVKAYDASWNLLTSAQLSALTAGDVVRFTVSGTPADQIDKAKFTINGVEGPEITNANKKPGTDEYYTEYTIPAGVTSFTVTAQIHHVTLNWF